VVLGVHAISGLVTLVGGSAEAARQALVPELLAMANLVLRNPADAVALEIVGSITITPHGNGLGVAIDDDGAVTMSNSNHLCVGSGPQKRVRYLAVAGGIAPAMGTRGVGMPVVVGDSLRPGNLRGALVGGPGRIDLRVGEPIGVRRGPDVARFPAGAFEALCRARCTVLPGGNRVASRLAVSSPAAAIAGGDGKPGAAVERGAIVVAHDGTLVVAGPDHPPSAVHPVLAVVEGADLGRLAARVDGADVAFAPR
jgi:allophanate hydrolase subunit 2